MTVAAVGIDPERAFLLSRTAGRAGVELESVLARLRADLAGECTGVPGLLGSTVSWLQSASADVERRARVAANDSMLGFVGPLHPSSSALYDDALLGLVTAGNALGVRLLLDGLSEEQLLAMASKVLGSLAAADLSEDERETYRRALLPLAAALLRLAAGPAAAVYAGDDSDASSRLARLTATVEKLMLLPPNREGSCWGAFFRGLFLGDWDRGYTTPGLESARVTGLLLSGLIPGVDLRDVGAAARNRDALSVLLGTVALVPLYGDLLRIGSRGAGTVLRLNRAGRRLGEMSKKADALAVSAGPVPAAAAGLARGRTVAGGIRNVTGGASGVASPGAAGAVAGPVVGLRDLPPDVRRGLQQVALGRVQGSPVERGEIGSLPKKDGGHFTRYSLGADVVAVTGADAELFVSRDGGCTWTTVVL